MEEYASEENYLTVASDNIKQAKTRLTKFIDRLYNDEGIPIDEWIEYIRDFIISSQRQNYMLSVIEKLSESSYTPVLPMKIKHYFIMFFNTEFQQAIYNRSVFYFLNASRNSFEESIQFFDEDDKILNMIINNPVIVEMTGQRGKGKTDFSTYLMEYIHLNDPKSIIITNIIFNEKPEYIKNVFNDYELLKEFNNDEHKYIFIDEAGLQFTNFNSYASVENKFLHQFLPLSRKFNCKFFFIYQIDRYTNHSLTDFTDIIMNKISKDRILILTNPTQANKKITIYNVDKSPLDYDTNAIAYFDTYINLKKLYPKLANVKYNDAKKILSDLLNKDNILNLIHDKKQTEFKELYNIKKDKTNKKVKQYDSNKNKKRLENKKS